jgi:hypothetical protein
MMLDVWARMPAQFHHGRHLTTTKRMPDGPNIFPFQYDGSV